MTDKKFDWSIYETGSSFESLMNYVIDSKTKAVDLKKLQKFEGRYGSNGGRSCDVLEGPCSCGAWH